MNTFSDSPSLSWLEAVQKFKDLEKTHFQENMTEKEKYSFSKRDENEEEKEIAALSEFIAEGDSPNIENMVRIIPQAKKIYTTAKKIESSVDTNMIYGYTKSDTLSKKRAASLLAAVHYGENFFSYSQAEGIKILQKFSRINPMQPNIVHAAKTLEFTLAYIQLLKTLGQIHPAVLATLPPEDKHKNDFLGEYFKNKRRDSFFTGTSKKQENQKKEGEQAIMKEGEKREKGEKQQKENKQQKKEKKIQKKGKQKKPSPLIIKVAKATLYFALGSTAIGAFS